MDNNFRNTLTKIREDDVKIEAVHELFSKITSMRFEEVVAAKNTMDLFLKVSQSITGEEKEIVKSILAALKGKSKVLCKKRYVDKDTVIAMCGFDWY